MPKTYVPIIWQFPSWYLLRAWSFRTPRQPLNEAQTRATISAAEALGTCGHGCLQLHQRTINAAGGTSRLESGAPWLQWETTSLKSNMESQNGGGWKIIWCSFSIAGFSGSMLVVWGTKCVHVHLFGWNIVNSWPDEQIIFTPHLAINLVFSAGSTGRSMMTWYFSRPTSTSIETKISLTPSFMLKV